MMQVDDDIGNDNRTIIHPLVRIQMEKQPNQTYPFSLQMLIPSAAKNGDQDMVKISQVDIKGKRV